jgi:hypothetical protein
MKIVKWKSHRAITREVCAALGLEDHYCELMVAGAVEPDRHHEVRKDKRGLYRRVRHHGSPNSVILMFVWKARMAFLEGDYEEASRDMGRALHYIQDRSVSKGWRGLSHDRREAAVAEVRVPVKAIEIGIEGAVSSPMFIRECILATKEHREPERSIFQASMISAAVAKAVVSDPDPPCGLEEALTRARWSYLFIAWPAAVAIGLGMISIASNTGRIWVAALLPLSVLLPILAWSRLRRLRSMALWYGLAGP